MDVCSQLEELSAELTKNSNILRRSPSFCPSYLLGDLVIFLCPTMPESHLELPHRDLGFSSSRIPELPALK